MQNLEEKIGEAPFPCIMAKAVMNQGIYLAKELESGDEFALANSMFTHLEDLVDSYRENPEKLHSCILSFSNPKFANFETFEKTFWRLLQGIRCIDGKKHAYDPRVSSNPEDGNFSFSVKEEAFFILMLHPESPRKARRFKCPAIVFNPHQQFEDLRARGTFEKTRSMIRARDERYQGSVNPMLMDFGSEVSEVFQYTGKNYSSEAKCPFHNSKGVA